MKSVLNTNKKYNHMEAKMFLDPNGGRVYATLRYNQVSSI